MPHCGFCGAEIPYDARFCGSCGHPIDDMLGGQRTGESKTVFSDPRLPRVLGAGQSPPSRVPMTPETPPVSGVPSVPGAPPRPAFTPRTPPPFYEPLTQLPYHPSASSPQQTEPPSGHQWPQQQQPLPQPRYQQIVRTPISQHPRAGRQGKAAHSFPFSASRWLFLIILAIVLIAGSGVILVFASSPALTLSGSQVVSSGEMLHLHGSGFIPGGIVHFTLDNNLSLAPVAQRVPEATPRHAGAATLAANAVEIATSLPSSASGTTVSVSVVGTFDANIPVTAQWQSGMHTIRATESLGSRSAAHAVTVQASGLSVSPSALNFNKVAQGKKVFLPLLIGNTGQQRLNWSAELAGAAWLSVPTSHGVVDPGNLRQIIYIQADTSNLSLGSHAATLRITANGGQKQVAIGIQVVQQQNQPALNLFPSSLDFGKVPAGQQATLQVAVSNLGGQALTWQVTTTNASWLTFSQSGGTVKSGGLPQTLYVTTNTASLTTGNYTAQLQFTSNGGNVSMTATLVVSTATTPTPSPSSSNPPTLAVTPTSLDSNTDCSYTQGYGWLCPITLENPSTTQGDLNWSASASGLSGILFYPSNSGAILPGEASQVYVFIPDTNCGATATLSFVGPANSVNVTWTCPTPPPPPKLTVTPQQLDQTQCSSNDGGQTYSCQLSVGESSDSQGNANWYAYGNLNESFNPAQGQLSPGGSTQVTISNIPCQSDTFTFTGDENEQPAYVTWTCVQPTPSPSPSPSPSPTPSPSPSPTPNNPPMLAVTPQELDPTQSACSTNDGQTYTCQVTISETSDSQGNANWYAYGNLNESFSPPQDQLSPGQSEPVIISNIPCQSDTITFAGYENEQSVTVSWSCSPTPTPSPSPSQNGTPTPTPTANITRWSLLRRLYSLT